MLNENIPLCLTFDDVLLQPAYSEVLPTEVDTKTKLTKNITLNIPILSAAMDTVTEAEMAIEIARAGGLGIIHRAMPADKQAFEIEKVKKSESGMIIDPITIGPDEPIQEALNLMERFHISGVPVTENGKLKGILTNRDLRFETNFNKKVKDVMTKDNLITAPVGIDLEQSKELLNKYKVEKLLIVDEDNNLKGLITIKDIEKKIKYPNACKDKLGRLRVGAAIGVGKDAIERAELLIRAGVDIIAIDTAHGHSKAVIDTIKEIKNRFDIEIIAGNVATEEGVIDLVKAGADVIKVGIGPGSICTTRIVAGAGVPQLTAIANCSKAADKLGVTIIADGGIKYSGDITKAIAAGAHAVMLGSLLAGTDEAPGDLILYQGRSYKQYRGMGSIGAMQKGSSDRYGQKGVDPSKLVPEGIEGRVPYKGPVSLILHQLVGGIKSGMGYTGSKNIEDLRTKTKFVQITNAAYRESHVHDVIITQEAPNYKIEN
ncbi:MAG TPA: IMP dehydrogenase [Ignavibacteriales bacterium]|nr:IMP dehydrogenase [Ignavibacteriales bacterium]HOL80962.1 IMP dehydrogenase [Ignavibacteriales bacterium]HOM64697.1 IMP dehydrogenase [Ignavibacteriales bacterium]HPD66771.1 IMP dehydrogenase [Ignavibacteriales bacterium]HPP32742.1 IMP dehydrogenase [Ignavibacteriales bacterium]